MDARSNITKRQIAQTNRDGKVFKYDRYLLHYRDPASGNRVDRRFNTRREAEAAQSTLIKNWDTLGRRVAKQAPTLQQAVDHWLECKRRVVTPSTHKNYAQVARDYIVGPALKASSAERMRYGHTGQLPRKAQWVPMLNGKTKIEEITTAELRKWLHRLQDIASPYLARMARKLVTSILRIAEEDFELRLARMPSRTGAKYRRKARLLLTDAETRLVLAEAQRDTKWGAYYAFLLLTGARPGEMLGLLWNEVDLVNGRVRICRGQNADGSIKDCPKTEAGNRTIPLNSTLRRMLAEWKERCPRLDGQLYRVFPAQLGDNGCGRPRAPEMKRALLLSNFRNRVWYPMLERLGLPQVSLYAARHMAISFLQAQGVEIGVVAKIAGHASPQITLQYYTHAVGERGDVMERLNAAYGITAPVQHLEAQALAIH